MKDSDQKESKRLESISNGNTCFDVDESHTINECNHNSTSSETPCGNQNLFGKVAKGLRKKKKEIFLKILYESTSKPACLICLEEYRNKEMVARSHNPSCDHVFHLSCISDWLVQHEGCPLCRAAFIDFDIENGTR